MAKGCCRHCDHRVASDHAAAVTDGGSRVGLRRAGIRPYLYPLVTARGRRAACAVVVAPVWGWRLAAAGLGLRIVVGPPVAGPGQACQTARMAGAFAAAWDRPALPPPPGATR